MPLSAHLASLSNPGLISDNFFLASVKRSPPAWPWVVLGTNRTESSLGGGEVGAQGAEETGYFSVFQSNEKASRMGSDVSYRICFLCFHGG